MATVVTNRKASQALRGETVKVTLDATDSAQLANMSIGQVATVDSSNNVGYVSRIDLYGHSFQVTPNMPNSYLESTSQKGYLINSEIIILA